MRYCFLWLATVLVCCKNTSSFTGKSNPTLDTVRFVVHMNPREKFYLNYVNDYLDPCILRFSNPGYDDTTIVKSLFLNKPTHFFYSSIIDSNGKIEIIQHDLIVNPNDSVEMESLHGDIAFCGVSKSKKFADDILSIDHRVPEFKLERNNFSLSRYSGSLNSIYLSNISKIKNAYERGEIDSIERRQFLMFNDLYICNEFMEPSLSKSLSSKIDFSKLDLNFVEARLKTSGELRSVFNSKILSGYISNYSQQNGMKNSLTIIDLIKDKINSDLYNPFVLLAIKEYPAKNSSAFKSFIDSFYTHTPDESIKKYLDSLRTIYYSLPKKSVKTAIGDMVDIRGNENQFNAVVSSHPGKLILVDFWASWCSPCRQQFPKLRAIKAKYSSAPVAFVSISIDQEQNNDEWLSASKAEKLGEENNFRLKKGNFNPLLKFYGIEFVPRYMLFDEKGKLVSANFYDPTDKNFESELNKYLGFLK